MLHEKVRKEYWGYAKNENLDVDSLIGAKYKGIRPAFGYPSMPDHGEKKILFDLLSVEENAGISLTENFAMYPAASVCGLYLAGKYSSYFNLGPVSEEQVIDYAHRKEINKHEAEKWLAQNLNYQSW